MSDRPTADDLRATVDDRRSIHSPDCWQRHPACALLLACDELDRLALLVLDQQAERERDEAVEALRLLADAYLPCPNETYRDSDGAMAPCGTCANCRLDALR